jgi:hypothetical protein
MVSLLKPALCILVLIGTLFMERAEAAKSPALISAESAIAVLHPDAQLESCAEGDLDGDGVADFAYLVRWPDTFEFVVGLLRGRCGANPLPWEHSLRFNPMQRAPEIRIERGSLFVAIFRNSSIEGRELSVQFQYRQSHFFLIGREEHEYSPLFEDDPGQRTDMVVSTNYLTRTELTTTRQDGKITRTHKVLPAGELDTLALFEGP